jgi:hypothetical protein
VTCLCSPYPIHVFCHCGGSIVLSSIIFFCHLVKANIRLFLSFLVSSLGAWYVLSNAFCHSWVQWPWSMLIQPIWDCATRASWKGPCVEMTWSAIALSRQCKIASCRLVFVCRFSICRFRVVNSLICQSVHVFVCIVF